MNILFYHNDETCPTMGGIQRTTAVIAEGLKTKYGHKCFNIYNYASPYPAEIPRYKYELSKRMPVDLSDEEIARFININNIDAIVNQMGIKENEIFRKAIDKSGRKCKLYYFHHNTPRRLWDLSFSGHIRKLKQCSSTFSFFKNLIKVVTFPLYKNFFKQRTLYRNAKDYKKIYNDADKFVLLSSYFIEEWKNLTGINDVSRLRAIPNARSFDTVADNNIIKKKEKKILLVARMVEFPKQILVALKIWQAISKKDKFIDWTFDIVGTGPDLEMYKTFVKKHNIPRVTFYGRKESIPFFQKASIFIMTSIREGWPMTLSEAMQMGVVPVVFDSFGSVKEIIQNGVNGFLIKPFDCKAFQEKVEVLMTDNQQRQAMAQNAIKSTERFTKDKILAMWQDLLSQNE